MFQSESEQDGRSWGDIKATRTNAMPKKTLFGSVLERKTQEELDDMQDMVDEPTTQEKVQNLRRELRRPSNSKNEFPGNKILEHNQEEVAKQEKNLKNATKLLDTLEEKSKYYAVNDTPLPNTASKRDRHPDWLSDSKKCNDLGVTKNAPNYDRDRYKNKINTHKYAQIGDPLQPGMDFSGGAPKKPAPRVEDPRRGLCMTNNYNNPYPNDKLKFYGPIEPVTTAIDVPANILHKYGTKVCNHLLANKDIVTKTMTDQQKHAERLRRKIEKQPEVKLPEVVMNPSYEAMGQALRQDMFPGNTYNNKSTLVQDTYTQDVFDRRVPETDKFKYTKDLHTKWIEQDVLRGRTNRAWDEMDLAKKNEKNS